MNKYIAHQIREDGKEPIDQLLIDHLVEVAELASHFAKPFQRGEFSELAYLLGLAHDLGKFSDAAQLRMRGADIQVDHSTAGGQEIAKVLGPIFADCVLGHHAGLLNMGSNADQDDEGTVLSRLKKTTENYSGYHDELVLKAPSKMPVLNPFSDYKGGFSCAFLVRMLFSTLVDADYLNTEYFMEQGKVNRGQHVDMDELLGCFTRYIAKFANPSTAIHKKRNEILEQCINRGKGEQGIYTLTVPTGGAKTISSLGFALHHCQKHGLLRIIYVIPYTSIIEQNAGVFKGILGDENVLEHHSNIDYEHPENSDQLKYLATENWDFPVVTSTNVQFFESLFSHRTSSCRKLHNIANSVIILDEAQMLPHPYLKACILALSELVHNYGCTIVLCTATQPAIKTMFPKELEINEICDDPQELQKFFKRVTYKNLGRIDDEELISRIKDEYQSLCIVNTRKHAQDLVQALGEKEGVFHLSTLMYPLHRKDKLEEIRNRLEKEKPCTVISTSLVEAGVDLDFPVVFRAKTGLDSIIQAAGRVNREGKRPLEDSYVYIFENSDHKAHPLMKVNVAAFDYALEHHTELDSLDAIEAYFHFLYNLKGDELDAKGIVKDLENNDFNFKTISQKFKLIEENTNAILIPDTPEAEALVERFRNGERSRQLLRQAGQYSVNVYNKHLRELYDKGIVEFLDESTPKEQGNSGIIVLSDPNAYDKTFGLKLEAETGDAKFI